MTTSPVVEEARRLAEALVEWGRLHAPAATGPAAAGQGAGLAATLMEYAAAWAGDHLGGGEQCTLCPVCQLLDAVRTGSPEVWEHLVAAGVSLSAALTALLETRRPAGPARAPVQRIPVG